MPKKRTPDETLHVKEQIGLLLRAHYQACTIEKLPPRLLTLIKKLDEKPELSTERQVIRERLED